MRELKGRARTQDGTLPPTLEAELHEEIRLHLEERAEELRAGGASPDEAWRTALAAFGDPDAVVREAIRERSRGIKGGGVVRTLESLAQDVRFGLKSLSRTPGFSLLVVLTLALGVGASTAMFSVVDGVLLRPLPYPEAERLVAAGFGSNAVPPTYTSLPEFIDLRDRTGSLEGLAGVQRSSMVIGGGGEPERVMIGNVTEGFLELFGVQMAAGRGFTEGEYRSTEPGVVVLSHGLWMRRWGGDLSLVGQTIRTDEDRSGSFRLLTVVGVLPPGFSPSPALQTAQGAEAWLPLNSGPAAYGENRTSRTLFIAGRLRAGIDLTTAKRDLEALSSELRSTYPTTYERPGGDLGMSVRSLTEATVADSRPMLLILLGAAAFLLLIGCANAANLILARAMERRRELALRSALGAGRGRLVRQLLTESLLIAALAGFVGVLTASGAVLAVRSFGPDAVPRLDSVGLDLRVLGFAMLATLCTGVIFGLVPALLGSAPGDANMVRGGRGGVSRGTQRLRSALVIGETALAVIVLAGAGLLINSYLAVARVDPGFVADGVSYTQVVPGPDYESDEQLAQFFADLANEVRGIPGVASAGIIADPPIGYTMWAPLVMLPDTPEESAPSVPAHLIDEGFLETMGVQIVQGRGLTALDGPASPPVAVINESMARQFWPDVDPIGERFRMSAASPWTTVVGVSNDVLQGGLTSAATSRFYVAFAQSGWFRYMNVVLKTRPGAEASIEALREAVHRVDPTVPFEGVTSMEQRISDSLRMRTFNTVLIVGFALVALVLATGGLYGTLRYVVERRTKEVGIRIALGGEPVRMIGVMLRHGIALAVGGIALGLPLAALTSRLVDALLFGVTPTDPQTLATVSALLLVVATVASYLPARRVARIDPVDVLRNE